MSSHKPPRGPFEGFRIEIDPERLEEASQRLRERLEEARDKVQQGLESGRTTRVRLLHKGERLGPDIPLTAFVAGQGVALVALGPLWTLLGNLGAKAVLDVQFIDEADELVARGNEAYLDGDLEAAEAAYRDALRIRSGHPGALYQLGVLLRVTGRTEEALRVMRQAAMGPEGHPDVARAAEAVDRMSGKRRL